MIGELLLDIFGYLQTLFWDINFDTINWRKYKKVVVKRVLQRGSKDENDEIVRFYNLSIDELQKYQPKDTRVHKFSENNEE